MQVPCAGGLLYLYKDPHAKVLIRDLYKVLGSPIYPSVLDFSAPGLLMHAGSIAGAPGSPVQGYLPVGISPMCQHRLKHLTALLPFYNVVCIHQCSIYC